MYLIKKNAVLYKVCDMSKHIVEEDFVARNASKHVGHIRFPYLGNSSYSFTFKDNTGLYKIITKNDLKQD